MVSHILYGLQVSLFEPKKLKRLLGCHMASIASYRQIFNTPFIYRSAIDDAGDNPERNGDEGKHSV